MQTLMPDGELLTETFEDMEALNKRRKQLEEAGGKVQRVFHVHTTPKYEPGTQGKKEMERRQRQLQTQLQRLAR